MTQATLDEVAVNNAQSKNAAELHTPALISPPDTRTPPTATHQRHQPSDIGVRRSERGSEAIDPDVLSNALKTFKDSGHQRDHIQGSSPSRKRQRIYGDR